MQAISRIAAFGVMAFLLSLPVLGDDKDNKADPAKDDPKKTDVKKDDPAKKDAKDDDSAKKDAGKKPGGMSKLPARKGKLKDHELDPAAAEKKLMRAATVQATVVNVVEDKKSLRLRLTIPYIKVNQGQLRNYVNAQESMMRAQNVREVESAQNKMAQAAARVYERATVQKEVEWTATDEVKVRTAEPPPQFDDKGKPKRYTRKELQELRGNDRQLPGYPAEFGDVKSGQVVVVTLLQKKGGPRPIRRGKNAGGEPSADNLPKISMILIAPQPKN